MDRYAATGDAVSCKGDTLLGSRLSGPCPTKVAGRQQRVLGKKVNKR